MVINPRACYQRELFRIIVRILNKCTTDLLGTTEIKLAFVNTDEQCFDIPIVQKA